MHPKVQAFLFSSIYPIVLCKMACTVVDIWSRWITLRDVPDLLLWETSAAWGNMIPHNWVCSRMKWNSCIMSILGIVQISVLILIHPYKRREWCLKTAFDISISLFLLRSTVKLLLSSTGTELRAGYDFLRILFVCSGAWENTWIYLPI